MSFEKAKADLEEKGLGDHVIVLNESSATVAEAAHALGVEPASIAKTLSVLQGEKPVLIVTEGTAKLDNHKYKSMTGHLLGGAGGVEAVFTALALRDQFAPPTIHYEQPDPECDLDYVPNVGRAQNMTYALSNSLGFGGHNACIALRRWEE